MFGASGRTGKLICEQAKSAGHQVVAIVRDPAKMTSIAEIEVTKADIFDVDQIKDALRGVDVVFDCLGSNDLGKSTLLQTTISIILDAIRACSIKRIIVLGASGALHDSMKHQKLGSKIFFWLIRNTFLRHPMLDSGAQQRIVEGSELQYTVVHAPRLTDGPRVGKYRIDFYGLPKGARELGREDLAEYMLSLVNDATTFRKSPYIAY